MVLRPGHGFCVRLHCDLDIGGMTLVQNHDTPFCRRQQMCEILSKSDEGLKIVKAGNYVKRRTERQDDSNKTKTLFTLGIIPTLFLRGL